MQHGPYIIEHATDQLNVFYTLLAGMDPDSTRALIIGFQPNNKRTYFGTLWDLYVSISDAHNSLHDAHWAYRSSDRSFEAMNALVSTVARCDTKIAKALSTWNRCISVLSGPSTGYQFSDFPTYPICYNDRDLNVQYEAARLYTRFDAQELQMAILGCSLNECEVRLAATLFCFESPLTPLP